MTISRGTVCAILLLLPFFSFADDKCPVVSTIDEIKMASLLNGKLPATEQARRLDEGISELKEHIKNKASPSGKPMNEVSLAGCKNQLIELQQARKKIH
jgi:hypothetical protein